MQRRKCLHPSHPSRVRGLKYFHINIIVKKHQVAPFAGAWIEIFYQSDKPFKITSHPSRVRGLKFDYEDNASGDVKSHPSRVRGLKLLSPLLFQVKKVSHPSRVRGLKYHFTIKLQLHQYVAPFAGAWIEIHLWMVCAFGNLRRTLRGCVD